VEPLVASAVVDLLKDRKGMLPVTRAQMLFEDAVRLASLDTARASARFREVAGLPEPPEYIERARLALTRRQIAKVSSVDELRPFTAELQARVASRTTAASEAGIVSAFVSQVLSAADSAAVGAALADLHLFLAAETARDSLAAPALAVSLFQTLVERLPDSPYAPKAILAGHALDPVWGESVLPLLEERYSLSPYVALVRGEEPYGYRELEDSLQIFARGVSVPRVGAPRAGPMLREDSLAAARGAAPRPRRGLEP
jgi:hypothetical protein